MKQDYKKLYKQVIKEYKDFYATLEATKLNQATGVLREYQLNTLNFCKKIIQQLDELNLPYFPIGGTLIGALRHGGFIPWDDDFDIGMMRKDYETFLKYCEQNYVCIAPEEISFSKNNRSLVWNKYLEMHPKQIIYSQTPHHTQIIYGTNIDDCVNIDIFAHDYYKEDITIEWYREYINKINKEKHCKDNFKTIIEYFEKERKTNPIFVDQSSRIYYGLDNIDNYILRHKNFFSYDTIFPLKKAKFEDIEISIQNNALEYAELQYSNCMSMPSDIEISPHINLRKENTEKHNHITGNKFKEFLYQLVFKICMRNVTDENLNYKSMVIREFKERLYSKKESEVLKKLYETTKQKLDFLKTIKP